MSFPRGARIGSYDIVEQIGAGGMFSASSTGRRLAQGWDVFPDGTRFILMAPVQSDQPQQTPAITVVQNWFAEFRDRHAPR